MSYDPNKKPINQSRIDDLIMDEKQIVDLLDKTIIGFLIRSGLKTRSQEA